MELSIFLAKVLGLYLLVFGVALLLNGQRLKAIVAEIDGNPALLLISGIIPLILGTLLIVAHQVWEADWRLAITLIGWLAFIKGCVRVTFPELALRFDSTVVNKPLTFKVAAVIVLLVGIFLCFAGYMS